MNDLCKNEYLQLLIPSLEQMPNIKTQEEAKGAFSDLENKLETVKKENLDLKERLSKFQIENFDLKSNWVFLSDAITIVVAVVVKFVFNV